MQIPLFCSRCAGQMEYDAGKRKTLCPACNGGKAKRVASPGSPTQVSKKRETEPLTEAQKAIKAEYAPPKRSGRFGGGHGVLIPEEIPESTIQENIMRALFEDGWVVVRLNSGAVKMKGSYLRAYRVMGMPERHASAGMPDVMAFKGTRALFIEVKDRLGKLRDSQVRFIEHARRSGVKVHLCRSWEEAQSLVDGIAAQNAKKPTRERWLELLEVERIAQRELGAKLPEILKQGEASVA